MATHRWIDIGVRSCVTFFVFCPFVCWLFAIVMNTLVYSILQIDIVFHLFKCLQLVFRFRISKLSSHSWLPSHSLTLAFWLLFRSVRQYQYKHEHRYVQPPKHAVGTHLIIFHTLLGKQFYLYLDLSMFYLHCMMQAPNSAANSNEIGNRPCRTSCLT